MHRQKALGDRDLLGYTDRLGLDRGRLGVDLPGRRCGSGSTPTPTAPEKAAPRGTPALFITGRLHAAGYDQATLRAALATATTER